jgi:hypothetical protein
MLGDLEDVERELARLPPGLPMAALAGRLGWNVIETAHSPAGRIVEVVRG